MAPSTTTRAKRKAIEPPTQNSPSLSKKERAANAKWSNKEIDSIVEQLKQAQIDSNTSNNGFKKSVWVSIGDSFKDMLKTDRVCQTKQSRLKGNYKDVKFVRELSGFGWDNKKFVPTAEDDVWDRLEEVSSTLYNQQCLY